MMEQTKVYKRRWAVLLSYIGVNCIIQCYWATFFSVTTQAWKFYGFADAASGEAAMSLLSIIIMCGVVVLSIPASAALEKIGWYRTVLIAGIILTVTANVRGLVGDSYRNIFFCTIAASACQPFILNAFGMLAAKWFPPKERALANGCGMLSIYIGVMAAQFGFPFLQKTFGMDIPAVLKVIGAGAVPLILLFFFISKEAPDTPPCNEAFTERAEYKEGLRLLLKNRRFIASSVIFLLAQGVYYVFTTLIEPIMQYLNQDRLDSMFIGILGTLITVTGCAGTLVLPMLTDRRKDGKRLPLIRLCLFIGAVGMICLALFHSRSGIIFGGCVYGVFVTGILPVILVFGIESGFPVSEGTTESLLQMFGNLGSMIMLLVINAAFSGNHRMTMIVLEIMLVLCILICFWTGEASRQERMLE